MYMCIINVGVMCAIGGIGHTYAIQYYERQHTKNQRNNQMYAILKLFFRYLLI